MICVLGMQLACACQPFLSSISWRGTGTSMPHFNSTSCRKSQESVTSKCIKFSCDHKIIARCTLWHPNSITSPEHGAPMEDISSTWCDVRSSEDLMVWWQRPSHNQEAAKHCSNKLKRMLAYQSHKGLLHWRSEGVMRKCEAKTEQIWQCATLEETCCLHYREISWKGIQI